MNHYLTIEVEGDSYYECICGTTFGNSDDVEEHLRKTAFVTQLSELIQQYINEQPILEYTNEGRQVKNIDFLGFSQWLKEYK